jgi:AraC-like DNA-binding protein
MWHDLVIYTPMYVTAFWAVVLLMAPKKNNRVKHFLGFFMVAAFWLYFSHTLFFKQQFNAYILIDPFYTFTSLSVYPLYYWYIKLLTSEPEIKIKNLKLLAPAFILSVTTMLLYLIMPANERMDYIIQFLLKKESIGELSALPKLQSRVFILGRLVFTVQVIFFLIYGRRLVIQYNRRISNFYSNLENKSVVWVNYLLYSFVATSLMSIVFNLVGRSVFIEFSGWLLLPSAIFSVLLFFIGFLGFMQNHSVFELHEDEKQEPSMVTTSFITESLKADLLRLFEEDKIYRDPNLKITDVTTKLHTNRTYISRLINQEFDASFSDFVNRYRVEDAKNILRNFPQKYSLNHVSENAGFGSPSSFNRIFKALTGLTPGQFREINSI